MKALQHRNFPAAILLAAVTAMLALLCMVTVTPLPAFAQEPERLTSNFEDYAGVIDNPDRVADAIDQVPGGDFWVVVVDDFSGMDAQTWAEETFERSRLQQYDALLAIAVESRELGGYAGQEEESSYSSGVSLHILDEATNQDALDKFGAEEWDEGIIQVADNIVKIQRGEALSGSASNEAGDSPSESSSSNSGSRLSTYILLVLAGVAVVTVIIIVKRKRKKTKQEQTRTAQELAEKASSELVQIDDAVRSASAELEFARAEFGLQATQEFAAALQKASTDIQRAFSLRTLLDDENPETPAQQKQMNEEILHLVSTTRAALSEQTEGFAHLRDLANRAPEKVEELRTRAGEVRASLPLAQEKLKNLALEYAPSMFSSLSTYPDQVQTLLERVEKSLADADSQLAEGDKNEAVGYVHLAEGTLANAVQLVEKIDAAPQLLQQAQQDLARNIASLSADVEDAKRLGGGDAAITGAANTAQEALAAASNTNGKDLLHLNEQLESAESHLDAALAGVRAAEEARIKSQQNAERAKVQANTAINNAEEQINRYRSGVSADARTYLARAKQAYADGLNLEGEAAQAHFQSAKDLAGQAINAAEMDFRRYSANFSASSSSQSGDTLGGMLAGMAISAVLNGISSGGGFSGISRASGGFGGFGGFTRGGGFGGGGRGFSSGGGFRKGF